MARSEIDQFLHATGLRIDHIPDDINHNFDLTDNAPIKILRRYDLNQEVICVYGHKHKSGAVALFKKGQQGLLGKECVKKRCGAEVWERLEKEERDEQTERIKLELIPKYVAEIKSIRSYITANEGRAKQKDIFFSDLNSCLPSIYKKLMELPLYSGQWSYPLNEKKSEVIGVIDGYDALKPDCNRRRCQIKAKIDKAQDLLETIPYKDSNVEEAGKRLAEARQLFTVLCEELSASQMFFTPYNFEIIKRAINEDPEIRQPSVTASLRKTSLRITHAYSWDDFHQDLSIPYSFSTKLRTG